VNDGAVVAIAVLAVLTTVGRFLQPGRARRRARKIERALARCPRAWIREARGPVRVSGRVVRAGDLLEAPLSGRPCVAYELVVQATEQRSGPGSVPRGVDKKEACSFLLEDESGTAQIDTSGPAFLAVVHDRAGVTGGVYPGEHRALSVILESHGLNPVNWLGRWRAIRYAEGVLEEGALVSVGGNGVREIDQGGDRRGHRSPPERLVLRGTDAQPLLIGCVGDER
jgi:hypothetical protein